MYARPYKIPSSTVALLSEENIVSRNKNPRSPLLAALTKFFTKLRICNGGKIIFSGGTYGSFLHFSNQLRDRFVEVLFYIMI